MIRSKNMEEHHNAARMIAPWALLLFTAAVAYGVTHVIEHVIQLYQHTVFNLDILHSHGILFFFDTEWIHFLFNSLMFASLLAVYLSLKLHRSAGVRSAGLGLAAMFLLLVIIEGWHLLEHVVRMYQHLSFGCQPCRGIFGQVVDVIYLHSFYNAAVTLSALFIYFKFGFARRLWDLL